MPANRNVTSIETASGRYVDLWHPSAADIILEDIAVHLSHIARYNGATHKPYSVAEHAVRVSYEFEQIEWAQPGIGLWPARTLGALHHDSHEAYMGDITAPLKAVLRMAGAEDALKLIAERLDYAIATALKLNVDYFKHPTVKVADDEVLFREVASLKWSHGIGPHWNQTEPAKPFAGIGWPAEVAADRFIQRHEELRRVG